MDEVQVRRNLREQRIQIHGRTNASCGCIAFGSLAAVFLGAYHFAGLARSPAVLLWSLAAASIGVSIALAGMRSAVSRKRALLETVTEEIVVELLRSWDTTQKAREFRTDPIARSKVSEELQKRLFEGSEANGIARAYDAQTLVDEIGFCIGFLMTETCRLADQ